MPERFVKVVTPTDNVATLLRDVEAGEVLDIEVDGEVVTVETTEDIVFGHKIALESIEPGETIVKYGTSIGNATEPIEPGAWIHVHNVESNYGRGDLAAGTEGGVVHE